MVLAERVKYLKECYMSLDTFKNTLDTTAIMNDIINPYKSNKDVMKYLNLNMNSFRSIIKPLNLLVVNETEEFSALMYAVNNLGSNKFYNTEPGANLDDRMSKQSLIYLTFQLASVVDYAINMIDELIKEFGNEGRKYYKKLSNEEMFPSFDANKHNLVGETSINLIKSCIDIYPKDVGDITKYTSVLSAYHCVLNDLENSDDTKLYYGLKERYDTIEFLFGHCCKDYPNSKFAVEFYISVVVKDALELLIRSVFSDSLADKLCEELTNPSKERMYNNTHDYDTGDFHLVKMDMTKPYTNPIAREAIDDDDDDYDD